MKVLTTVREFFGNPSVNGFQESNNNLNDTSDKNNNSKLAMIGREERIQITEKTENKEYEGNHNNNNNLALLPSTSIPNNNNYHKTYTSISNKTNNDINGFGYIRRSEIREPKQPQEQIAEQYEKKPSWWLEFSEKDIDQQQNPPSQSTFQQRFSKIKWYGFIHTVSCALTIWKSSLRFIRIDFATQTQLEAINDASFYQSEWTKSLQREKAQARKKQQGNNYGFTQNKCLRRLKKNTRVIRKTYKELKLKAQEIIQSLGYSIRKKLKHVPVFDPLSQVVLYWELGYFLLSLFLFTYLPYSVSFESTNSALTQSYTIQWILLAIFLILDIFKNALTASYIKGEIIKEPLMIIKNYIKTLEMPLDIFTVLTILGFVEFTYSQAVFLLRFFYKPTLIQKFKDALSMSETLIAVMDLVNLFATILYLGHIVASIWHLVGQIQADNKNEGWIVKYNFVDDSTASLYINSYFFAIINMSSVKGTILPSTNTEKILCMILPFGACVLYGYTITSITIILRNINTKRDNFNLLMSKINKYMRRYNVDPTYQTRARKYVEYMKDSSLEERKTSRNILNCLSSSLKDDIFINIFQQSLKRQPFIQKNISKECVQMLALKMTSQFFASNETIVDTNVITEPSLFVIVDGQVEEYLYPNKQPDFVETTVDIRIKKKGDVLSEFEFFTHQLKPNSSVRSLGVSELHILKYKDFIEVLEKFSTDKESFANLRDQLIFNRQLSYLNIECIFCNEKDHVERDCPQTFYERRRVAMRRKFGAGQKSNEKIKKKIKRKRKGNKFQALVNLRAVEQSALCFLEDNIDEPTEINDDNVYTLTQLSSDNFKNERLNGSSESANGRNMQEDKPIINLNRNFSELQSFQQETLAPFSQNPSKNKIPLRSNEQIRSWENLNSNNNISNKDSQLLQLHVTPNGSISIYQNTNSHNQLSSFDLLNSSNANESNLLSISDRKYNNNNNHQNIKPIKSNGNGISGVLHFQQDDNYLTPIVVQEITEENNNSILSPGDQYRHPDQICQDSQSKTNLQVTKSKNKSNQLFVSSPPCPGQELDNFQRPFASPNQTSIKPKPQFQEQLPLSPYLMSFCSTNSNNNNNNNNSNGKDNVVEKNSTNNNNGIVKDDLTKKVNTSNNVQFFNQNKQQNKRQSASLASQTAMLQVNGRAANNNTPGGRRTSLPVMLGNTKNKGNLNEEENLKVTDEIDEDDGDDDDDDSSMESESSSQSNTGTLAYIPNINSYLNNNNNLTNTNQVRSASNLTNQYHSRSHNSLPRNNNNNNFAIKQTVSQNYPINGHHNLVDSPGTNPSNYFNQQQQQQQQQHQPKSSLKPRSNNNLNCYDLNSQKSLKSTSSNVMLYPNNIFKQRNSIVSVNFALPQQTNSQQPSQQLQINQGTNLDDNGLSLLNKMSSNINNDFLLTKQTSKSFRLKQHESVDYSKMEEFKIYFPHNNFSNIIKPQESQMARKSKRKQTIINILLKEQMKKKK